jgi:hypothetical protein
LETPAAAAIDFKDAFFILNRLSQLKCTSKLCA